MGGPCSVPRPVDSTLAAAVPKTSRCGSPTPDKGSFGTYSEMNASFSLGWGAAGTVSV